MPLIKKATSPFVLFLFVLLAACSRSPSTIPLTPTPPAELTATLRPPQMYVTPAPDVVRAARAYLDAWKAGEYETMYALLNQDSQAAITQEDFIKHYQGVAAEIALTDLDYELISPQINPSSAHVGYSLVLHSALVGDVPDQTQMNLVLEGGQWRVVWADTLVMSHLNGGNYLKMERAGFTPTRTSLYDRNGNVLAGPTDAVSIGLRPDNIDFERADDLYAVLGRVTGIPAQNIQRMVEASLPGAYIPLAELTAEEFAQRGGGAANFSGVEIQPYTANRFYAESGIAPHLLGYVGEIQAEVLEDYRRRGFQPGEVVGQSGLELWAEPYLAGQRGGQLYVYNAQHQPVQLLVEQPAEPSMEVYTTIDRDFQEAVQLAITGFRGAVVVLERDTGRVLAMASSPGFDQNAFARENYNSYSLLVGLNDPEQPLYNRAAKGLYPLGSVFKIITMAAGIESGMFTPETTYECGYHFTDVQGQVLNDWTWEHFQEDEETLPSGTLTLSEGLIRSCNLWFYHIGLELFRAGKTTAVSDMARGFGLGSPTGLEGVEELPGNVPDPQSELDATNLGIGQGNLQVTPLQVANFVAAVGNGGTLYTPQAIERIVPPGGEPVFTFTPEARGQLPVSPETLLAIQEAMKGVVNSASPRGTAYSVFRGLQLNIAGKTGTAQSGSGESHAWFAGYTYEEREHQPDIAIAVIAENAGEGSEIAAPIFRRVIEQYFFGRPGRLYDWEEAYYVRATPEPEETEEPETTEEPIDEDEVLDVDETLDVDESLDVDETLDVDEDLDVEVTPEP